MQIVKYIIIYFLLLFIETNLLHLVSINNVTPDLILVFVIIISLQENRSKATLIGFVAGLIQDIFSTHFFGLSALTKSIVGFWGVQFQQSKRNYNLSYYLLVVAILTLLQEFIFGFIYNFGTQLGFFRLCWQYALPKALYTLFMAVIAYLIFRPMLWRSERLLE